MQTLLSSPVLLNISMIFTKLKIIETLNNFNVSILIYLIL